MAVEPNLGVLDIKVQSLELAYKDLNTQLNHLGSRIDDKLAALSSLFSERSRTQWPLLISMGTLLFMITSALGFLTLEPLKARQGDLAEIIKEIRIQQVPRGEMLERWAQSAREFESVKQTHVDAIEFVQSQLDDVKARYRDIYSARDVIKDLGDRLKELETQRNRAWETAVEKAR